MKSKLIVSLVILFSIVSCIQSHDSDDKSQKESYKYPDGFIRTEKMRKQEEKILNGIKPKKLNNYPIELKKKIAQYVTEKHGKNLIYDYVVYYSTIIEYSPDTIGYLDSNHYSIDLKIYKSSDTIESYLRYSKDFKLDFNFGH